MRLPTVIETLEPINLNLVEILGPAAGNGLAFIRHGWPKLRNLRTWATTMSTPEWLCFLSSASMFGGGIALLLGLLTPLAAFAILVSMVYPVVLEIRSGFPFIAPDLYQIPQGDDAGPMGVGEPLEASSPSTISSSPTL